ncbi:hypothetical protein KKC1_09410 [Calderihabitans maritimus]|uniref:Uncharacterized protein n=1 Tax=Calderihabitans maritimus TaxID=1246530 RepID=A0A1Z5HR42_9FIRM|nr:hypothetical protein KKC1_09410 [Calderihabitans maritimus]
MKASTGTILVEAFAETPSDVGFESHRLHQTITGRFEAG